MGLYEIRWHGRGGQGAVTGARILAHAGHIEGKHTQSFPHYGSERRGAPVRAFTRISDEKIYIHSEVYQPDAVVILDPSLLSAIDATSGLKNDGVLVINSLPTTKVPKAFRAFTVDATKISLKYGILVAGTPVVNTSILGAIAKATQTVKLDSVLKAINSYFTDISSKKSALRNVNAANQAYKEAIQSVQRKGR